MPTTAERIATPRRRRSATVARYAIPVVLALAVLAVVHGYVARSYVIPSGSMEPALMPGERVIVIPSAYRFGGTIHRGDVVVLDGDGVFDFPSERSKGGPVVLLRRLLGRIGLPVAGGHDYAKRVIGLPGERVSCCDSAGRLMIGGRPLDEPWVKGERASAVRFDVVVPAGRYWVLGDNRDSSADSRSHIGDPGGGMVPSDRIVGKIVAVYWPANRLRAVPDGEGSS